MNSIWMVRMSQSIGEVYQTFVLPCGTIWLYSDVVEFSPLDQRVPVSIPDWTWRFLIIRDR